MSYQQGYPQQQNTYQAAPPAAPSRGASPAMAILAAVLGLVAAAALAIVNFKRLGDLPPGAGFGDLPGAYKTVVILWFGAALILVIGAIIVFVRKTAGAFVLVLGGLAGIAAVLLYPVILGDAIGIKIEMGEYLKEVFKFDGTESTFSAVALIASPLALIDAILPPSLRWLRGGGRTNEFADFARGQQAEYGQSPQQEYGQPPRQDYGQAPQQGQHDYGQYSPPQGFPQQQQPYQQQPGYPQQPQQPNW